MSTTQARTSAMALARGVIAAPADAPTAELLRSNIRSVVIEVTSKCNLRCTYCIKADSNYDVLPFVNADLTDDALRSLYDYCKANAIIDVALSGVGETAMTAGWQKRLSSFLDDDEIEVYLVSNLVRKLRADDIDALCKLKVLQVSFDSADPDMVRMLRSKARLSYIIDNIERLKRAIAATQRGPHILVNCTVSRQNIGHIASLAELCRRLGVNTLLLGEMMVMNRQSNIEPLSALSAEEIAAFTREIVAAERILDGSATSFQLQKALELRFGDLLEHERAGLPIVAPADVFHRPLQSSSCTQPWDKPFIRADGKVFPCCNYQDDVAPIGDVAEQSLHEIYDSEAARVIRRSILAGDPILRCEGCTLASDLSFAEFNADIAARLGVGTPVETRMTLWQQPLIGRPARQWAATENASLHDQQGALRLAEDPVYAYHRLLGRMDGGRAGQAAVLSLLAKPAGRSGLRVEVHDDGTATYVTARFDLKTGRRLDADGPATEITIDPADDGYYRLAVGFVPRADSHIHFAVTLLNSDNSIVYAGRDNKAVLLRNFDIQ